MGKEENVFVEDERFKQCAKEMWVVLGLFVVNMIILGGISFAIGLNKPADEIGIVLGLPAWFFWGGIVGTAIFCVLPFIMVKYFFKEISIEAEENGGGDQE